MDPKDLLLTSDDVPRGFELQGEAQRPLEVGMGKYAEQAHRAFQKGRILNFSDAIWSEATVFPDADSAGGGFGRIVEYHKVNPGYADVREIGHQFCDDSYVHTGTMRGKPGLWAAVRTGSVVHRFNTYNVEEAVSRALLDRQLAKQARPAAAISIAEAVQMSYVGFIDAFKTRDMDQVNEWWLRLQLAVQKGRYKELQPLLDAFWDATGSGDQDELKRTMERLSAAVASLK